MRQVLSILPAKDEFWTFGEHNFHSAAAGLLSKSQKGTMPSALLCCSRANLTPHLFRNPPVFAKSFSVNDSAAAHTGQPRNFKACAVLQDKHFRQNFFSNFHLILHLTSGCGAMKEHSGAVSERLETVLEGQ